MAIFNKFNQFVADKNNGVHNLGSDTLKAMFTNTAPTSADSLKSDITEISAGGGYTTGGEAITVTSSTQTGGTYSLVTVDKVFTATGAVNTFRYVVLYNDTPTSPLKPLIGFFDYGSAITMANAETFTIDFGATTITDV